MKKGQAWSIDAIVGVFLFVIIVMSVIAFTISKAHSQEMTKLQEDGSKLFSSLSGNLNIIKERKIDPDALADLSGKSYEELKDEFNIRSDFCIYFVDDQGNLVFLDELGSKVGLGSPDVLINNIPCNSS